MSSGTNQTRRPRGHVRPSPTTAARVREFVAAHGEPAAMDHFGLSRIAVARAAAGMVVQGATLFAIEDGLRRADQDEP